MTGGHVSPSYRKDADPLLELVNAFMLCLCIWLWVNSVINSLVLFYTVFVFTDDVTTYKKMILTYI